MFIHHFTLHAGATSLRKHEQFQTQNMNKEKSTINRFTRDYNRACNALKAMISACNANGSRLCSDAHLIWMPHSGALWWVASNETARIYKLQRKKLSCVANMVDSSTKPAPSCSASRLLSNKPNSTSLASLLAESAYLSMLLILLLACSAGQVKIK